VRECVQEEGRFDGHPDELARRRQVPLIPVIAATQTLPVLSMGRLTIEMPVPPAIVRAANPKPAPRTGSSGHHVTLNAPNRLADRYQGGNSSLTGNQLPYSTGSDILRFMKFLRRPTRLILTALADRPMHGYGILRAVEELSGGTVKLAVGTLYGALERLESEGAIEQDHEEVENGRLRRYYRLTADGVAVLSAEVAVLEADVQAARTRLAIHTESRLAGGTG